MARHERVASRYAKALFDHLGDVEKSRSVQRELEGFSNLVNTHADLTKVLHRELFPLVQRRAVIQDIVQKLKLSQVSTRILIVLSESRRLGLLSVIVEKLKLLLLQASSIVPLQIETATDLTQDEREKIERKFSRILKQKVDANYIVDPTVIGGLRVTASGRTYDGTISGWLSAIREQLAEGSN